MQVSAGYLRLVERLAKEHGWDVDELFAAAGLSPEIIGSPSGRIPYSNLNRLIVRLDELSGAADLGLQLASKVAANTYHLLGMSMMSCANGLESLNYFLRYQHIAGTVGTTELDMGCDQGEARIIWTPRSDSINRHIAELIVAGGVSMSRYIAGDTLSLSRVTFTHKAPDNLFKHQAYFKAPVLFDQAETAVYFDTQVLYQPFDNADREVHRILDEQLRKFEQEMGGGQLSLAEHVARLLERSMQSGCKFSIDSVAAQLKIGRRSLQRSLRQEQTRYSTILDEVRRKNVKTYLDQGLLLADVAYLLGFNDQSSFNRAFKKWWGCSPTEYIATNQ